MLIICKENVFLELEHKKPHRLSPGGVGKLFTLPREHRRRKTPVSSGPVQATNSLQHFPIGRRGKADLLPKNLCRMAVVIHVAGSKGLGHGKVGIQQLLLQLADFVFDIILMGCQAGMLLKQLGEMGLAEAGRPGRFVGIKGILPVALYVLFGPEDFLFALIDIFENKKGSKTLDRTGSI